MNGENRLLYTDELAEFEKELVEIHQDFRKIIPLILEDSVEYTSNQIKKQLKDLESMET